MTAFARVTELDGSVQWINLDHVRQIVERKPMKGFPVVTAVNIGNMWAERQVTVTQTPEEILASAWLRGNQPGT
jgi:hypothetical protein